jgi:hypothetical protein
MKNITLFIFLIISSISYCQEVITEKLLFKTNDKIRFGENSRVYSIKDQGFVVYNKFSKEETVIMYDFDFKQKWKHSHAEIMLPFKYLEYSSGYFVGDSQNVFYIQIGSIKNQILITQISRDGKITKKLGAINDKHVHTPIGAYIINGKLIILTLYENKSSEIAMHTVGSDLTITSNKINFPYDAFELDENLWGENYLHGYKCMYIPRGVINDKIIFVKTYVKGKTKEEQKFICKTIEMDFKGVLLNEYIYEFKNTSGTALKEAFVQSIIDSEKMELVIVGELGSWKSINVSNGNTGSEGLFICNYKYQGESLYQKFLLTEETKISSFGLSPENIIFDRFNDNVILISSITDGLGDEVGAISFTDDGEIVAKDKLIRGSYSHSGATILTKFSAFEGLPFVSLTGVKKVTQVLKNDSPNRKLNSLDFTYKFISDDYRKIIFYEFTDNYTIRLKNKEFSFVFMFHEGLGEMKAYKLKR